MTRQEWRMIARDGIGSVDVYAEAWIHDWHGSNVDAETARAHDHPDDAVREYVESLGGVVPDHDLLIDGVEETPVSDVVSYLLALLRDYDQDPDAPGVHEGLSIPTDTTEFRAVEDAISGWVHSWRGRLALRPACTTIVYTPDDVRRVLAARMMEVTP